MKKTRSLYCALFLITWVVLWALCWSRRAAGAEFDCLIGTGEYGVPLTTAGDQNQPSVVRSLRGTSTFVWVSETSENIRNIYIRQANSKGPAGEQLPVVTAATGTLRSPSLMLLPDDSIVVVWAQYTDAQTGWDVYARRFSPSAIPIEPAFRVNTTVPGDQLNPRVAGTSSGTYCVVWEGSDGRSELSNIYVQQVISGSRLLGPELRVNGTVVGNCTEPRIAAVDNQYFVIVWTQPPAGNYDPDGGLRKRALQSGTSSFLGPDVNVVQNSEGHQDSPALSSIGRQYIVTWRNESSKGIVSYRARIFNSSSNYPTEFSLQAPEAVEAAPLGVALSTDESFIVAWNVHQGGAAGRDVLAQRYAPNRLPVGRPVTAHVATAGDQVYDGAVGMAAAGTNVVFVWTAMGLDQSFAGVFAQVFGLPTTISVGSVNTTVGPEHVALSGAAIAGKAPQQIPGAAWFEYGATVNFGQRTKDATFVGNVNLNEEIEGLLSHTLYYVRMVARDGAGTFFGPRTSFTTLNRDPVLEDDTYHITTTGGALKLPVLLNDREPDGDPLTLRSVSGASHGNVAVDGDAILYTPEPGWDGNDVFTYEVVDGYKGYSKATVTLINRAPVAALDTVNAAFESAASVAVLANDSDPDEDAISLSSFEQPKHGTVTELRPGVLRYIPDASFTGTDSFRYEVSDGWHLSGTGTVTVRVAPPKSPSIRSAFRRGSLVSMTDPRLPLGAEWRAFGAPVTDRDGDVAFTAFVAAEGGQRTGVFGPGIDGQFSAIALSKVAAPDVPDWEFASFRELSVARVPRGSTESSRPAIAFTATVRSSIGVQGRQQGLWSTAGADGALRLVLMEGKALRSSDLAQAEVRAIRSFALSRDAVWVVVALKRGSGGVTASNDLALVRWDGEQVSVALRNGGLVQDATGTSQVAAITGVRLVDSGSGEDLQNTNHADVVCRVKLSNGREALVNGATLLNEASQLVGPALPAARWARLGVPTAFRAGEGDDISVAFAGGVTLGAGKNATPPVQVIYRQTESSGVLSGEAIARSGDMVPGRGDLVFRGFGDPAATHGGRLAFLASVSGLRSRDTRRTVLCATVGSTVRTVSEEGGSIAELPDVKVNRITGFGLPSSNLDGAPAAPVVEGTLAPKNAGKEVVERRAIWTLDPSGRQRLVLRQGMPMGIGASAKTLRSFSGLRRNPSKGLPSGGVLDAQRHFVSVATYSDGSEEILRVTLP